MKAPINAKVECSCQHSSACRIARFLIVALALGATPVLGQTPPTTAPNLTEGTKIYAQRCAGCHGADAHGTDKAPGLAGNQRLRDGSVQDLRDVIRKGVPGSGMPAFDSPPQELDSLVVLVRSLNAPSAESTVGGDATAGESFFFGKGQCASCHMVSGAGAAIGPDLSNVGREMTVDEIQAKLVNPDSRIAPGYELATAQLRNGNTIRGFVRNRSNFDIRLQDLTGQLHLIQQGEISAITEEKQSIMPPVKAGPAELQDLVAFLGRHTGVGVGATKFQPTKAPGIDFVRTSNPKPGEWRTYNGNLSGNRYSELTQINNTSVHQLTLKWIF